SFSDPIRAGIVHRLDKDTSGLLLVAKTEDIHLALSRALIARNIKRKYFAIVWGRITSDGKIVAPIGRSPKDPTRMAVVECGRKAVTHYKVIANYDFLTSLSLELETGRTHQIRVHMWYIGHPVFGDPVYAGREDRLGGIHPNYRTKAKNLLQLIQRQALHAQSLSFYHPITGAKMEFQSELPPDIKSILDYLENPKD
ncbi:MAG: RluA family pseudouridine synthase, partial [bacterium]